jgi:imidazolonepropionase-like amidohydrolase
MQRRLLDNPWILPTAIFHEGPQMIHRHATRVRGAASSFAVLVGMMAPGAAQAQFVEPPPPVAFALQNVTVVRSDGTQTAGQTIVIRAGRIEAIGRGVPVPADARVLAGDSLYVYPGLIDGAGTVKFEFPRDTTSRERVRSWDAPRGVQGFVPARRVLDYLAATGADGAALRKQGVVAVAVHPSHTDPLMPGRGTFVLLRRDAGTPQQLVVDPVLPPVLTLRGGRGVYPSTGMAVVQWYRQLFMDARRQTQLIQVASSDPRAVLPPAWDADMAVVQELLRGDGRVFFAANDADEIRRVLGLADEFGLRPVILGGAEAWRVADELRTRNVPVLVNVDFETPRRWKPDARDTTPAATTDPALLREKRQFEELYGNAGRLAAANVTFALVSGGRGDVRAGARRAIEYGLPEAAALRALTATPAALYGAAHLARLEAGLPATLIVTDAPLFGRDTRILYTFVEGALEKGADARAARDTTAAEGDAVDVAGTWQVEVITEGTLSFTMRLTQEGTALTGSLEGPMGSIPITGSIEGDRLRLNGTLTMGGQSGPLTLSGTVRDEEVRGSAETPMGDAEWSARRTGPGAER